MIVTRAQLDELHRRLRDEVRDPRAGVFGPDSAYWRVAREGVLFLGGGRAILLQLAHPFVAHAVAEHSQLEADPLGRFRRTFDAVYAMVFGDLDHAIAYSRRVHALHSRIQGDGYQANDRDALLWVHATLVDTSVLVYERVLGPMAAAAKEAYYQDSKRFAALFGLAEADLPADWSAFAAYVRAMLDSPTLAVDDVARELAGYIFARDGVQRPLYRTVAAVTAGLLPPRLRRAFGLSWGAADRALAGATLLAARAAHPLLPRSLRHVPAYAHAMRRLA